jgi:hypothetical protein
MVITVILLYSALGLGFKGPALWAVIIFHTIQSVIAFAGTGMVRKQ